MGQALPELFTRRIALDDVGSHADAADPDQEDVLDLEAVYRLEDSSVSEGRVTERTDGCLAFEAAHDLHGQSGDGWVGVDLDGTLAEYDGWKGIEHIGDPIPAMLERVKEKLARGEDVRIFTARVAGPDGEKARRYIDVWCQKHLGRTLPVTNVKDQQMTELWDDRAVQVEANTGRLVDGLEAWTPYHGKRGGKGWQKDGQGKPRYQEEKPGDDEAPVGKPDMPVVKIDASGSRQPALFDKLDDGGPTGESEPVAEKPPEVANIPSAPANKQVEAEPDVKPMEVKTMKRVAKTKSGLDVELEATPRGVSFSVEHPQAGHLAGNLTIWDNAKKVAWTDVSFNGQPVGLSISKADYDAAKSDVQDAIEADRKDYERTHPGAVERREIADMMRRADYWENNSKYQDFGKAASLRAEARARMDEWKQKYPKEWAEEHGNDLRSRADRQRELATGASLYDADGLLSAADQDHRAEEFRTRADELDREAEKTKREAGP